MNPPTPILHIIWKTAETIKGGKEAGRQGGKEARRKKVMGKGNMSIHN